MPADSTEHVTYRGVGVDDDAAAVIVQNPNFFGCIDDFTDLAEMAHSRGALLIMSCYPIALGILKTPREMGADIVTGEGQSLGIPMSFGGPYLGFMGATKKLVRKMPGRVVGQTLDKHGQRAFVLTLQAREQHIRRDKATSNICTNQSLNAIAATIHLAWLGTAGLADVGNQSVQKAHYLAKRLQQLPGVKMATPEGSFAREFAILTPSDPHRVVEQMAARGYLAGIPLSDDYPEFGGGLLIAVTERRSVTELDGYVIALEEVLADD